MTEKKNTMERMVKSYLPPLVHRYFQGYVALQELSESAAAAQIFKQFFDSLPQAEKERLLQKEAHRASKNSY